MSILSVRDYFNKDFLYMPKQRVNLETKGNNKSNNIPI